MNESLKRAMIFDKSRLSTPNVVQKKKITWFVRSFFFSREKKEEEEGSITSNFLFLVVLENLNGP